MSLLDIEKKNRLRDFTDDFNYFVDQTFPAHRKSIWLMLLIEAIDKNYPARKSNIYAIIEWTKSCLDYYATKAGEIMTSEDPQNVVWDLSGNCPAAPDISIVDNYRLNE